MEHRTMAHAIALEVQLFLREELRIANKNLAELQPTTGCQGIYVYREGSWARHMGAVREMRRKRGNEGKK